MTAIVNMRKIVAQDGGKSPIVSAENWQPS